MQKPSLCYLIALVTALVSGCAATTGIDPGTLQSQDEKALYDLMLERGRALNARDMDMFRRLYTKDSPELAWIKNKGIPGWEQSGMRYSEPSLKKISIVGRDAAAAFVLIGRNGSGRSFLFQVEALYVKIDSQWKIEATGAR